MWAYYCLSLLINYETTVLLVAITVHFKFVIFLLPSLRLMVFHPQKNLKDKKQI